MGVQGQFAQQRTCTTHVRFGSKADIGLASVDVRFTPNSGHCWVRLGCPLSANSGHGPVSFDYLIRDLMAPCHVDSGVPSNRDGERKREGRC
jgi:hypothetical protein